MKLRLLALATLLVAAVAAPATAQTPAPQRDSHAIVTTGVTAGVTTGAGWYLTEIDRGKPGPYGIRTHQIKLVLVAPDGHRTQILQRAAGKAGWHLVDWSPDGTTALLTSARESGTRALRVDVATGDTQALDLPANSSTVILAPDGDGVLVVGYEHEHSEKAALYAVDWDGHRTAVSPDVDGVVLPSPDGTSLVTHGSSYRSKVIRVLSATDGSVVRRITTPTHCQPVRWWDDHQALIGCSAPRGTTTLSLVDTATGVVTPLTTRHDPGPQDLGHLDARRIDSGLYVQVAGPCGYVYLGHQHGNGRITHVQVPGAVGNVLLIDGSGTRLTLEHAISCDGATPRAALTRYDPTTRKEHTLVLLPRTEAFGAVLPYGEQRGTGF